MDDAAAAESAEIAEIADPIRDRLLDAAARVFARKGFDGTKILDIVKEAGLSTGAVYGRFGGKQELLREAVIRRSSSIAARRDQSERVADLMARVAVPDEAPLTDSEATLLEAYVTARREPAVAAALAEANAEWRRAVEPLVQAAGTDGTVAADVDPEAVLFFARVMHLGLLLHRGSNLPTPDPASWQALVVRIVSSFGRTDHQGEAP